MIEKKLVVERLDPGIIVMTLNRPDVMNAIDMELASLLFDALADADDDPNARCVVMTGAGDRAFCTGFDIHELAGFDDRAMLHAFTYRDPLMLRVAEHRLPVLVALNGMAYGAGALISAAADIRIADPSARFKVTATAYDGANATWSLPALVGVAKAKELLMTGRVVGAEEGQAIGLFNAVSVPGAALDDAVAMARQIAANPPNGVAGIKRLVNEAGQRDPAAGWRAEFDFMVKSLLSAGNSGDQVFSGFLGRDRKG